VCVYIHTSMYTHTVHTHCTHTHTHTHAKTHRYTHTYTHVYTYTHVCTYTHTCTHTRVHTQTQAVENLEFSVESLKHLRMESHHLEAMSIATSIHTHTHTHTYTHVRWNRMNKVRCLLSSAHFYKCYNRYHLEICSQVKQCLLPPLKRALRV
jgi:predicted 3-demethylubiquinone-9 3-methyltransferase (glyoxalase superfamily)